MKKTLLFVVILCVLSACSSEQETTKCVKDDYIESIMPIHEEWFDSLDWDSSTTSSISQLLEIKRRMDNVEIDECFSDAHEYLIEAMDYTIKAKIAFFTEDYDKAEHYFNLAETSIKSWELFYLFTESEDE